MKCLICKEDYTEEEIREMDESYRDEAVLICCDCYDKFSRMNPEDCVKLLAENNKDEGSLESDLRMVCNFIADIENAAKRAQVSISEFNNNYSHFQINFRIKELLNNILCLIRDIKDYNVLMGKGNIDSYLKEGKK